MAEAALVGIIAALALVSAVMWAVTGLGAARGCPFCKGFITPWGLLKRPRDTGDDANG